MNTRHCLAAALALGLTACAGDARPADQAEAPAEAAAPLPAGDQFTGADTTLMQRSATGLFMLDLHEGEGEPLAAGQTAVVHYTGWLTNGTKFDSSRDRNEPYDVVVGQGQVIAGWDEGLQGMKVGGHRQLVVPPELGYGPAGRGGAIPPNATLVFLVELVQVK